MFGCRLGSFVRSDPQTILKHPRTIPKHPQTITQTNSGNVIIESMLVNTVVPEPASLAVLALTLLGVTGRRRRS